MNYTEQLERETERTRADLANTVEELRERLTPGEVLDEVLDYASDGEVGDFLRNFRRQVVANPVALGLMGVSIAWLIAASTFGGRRPDRRMSEAAGDRIGRKAGDFAAKAQAAGRAFADRTEDLQARATIQARDLAGSAANEAGELAERAADRVGDMAERAADGAATIAGRTSDQIAKVAEQANAAAARVGDRMRSAASAAGANLAAAGDGLTDSMRGGARVMGNAATELARSSRSARRAVVDFGRDQPLIVAATGLVLGAIVGALLPSTQFEDELVGETSDAAKDRLREMAGEQYEKVKDVAVRTAEAALDATGPTESSSHEGAEGREPREFGPGPGDHDEAAHASDDPAGPAHASDDHTNGAEEAEHTRAGGS